MPAANISADLRQTAVNSGDFHVRSFNTIASRDATAGEGTIRTGDKAFVQADGLYYEWDGAAFALDATLNGATRTVADVVARDAIAAGARFDGMLVESQASFITWRLRADLTTWDAVANNSPDFLTFDPVLLTFNIFVRVHNVYVETTGDDAAGEGTVANPYASIQAAIDSVSGQKSAMIQVRLGLGSFTVDSIVVKDATSAIAIIGTPVVVESLAAPTSSIADPNREGVFVNTYAVAPSTTIINGTHFYDSDFGITGIPEFFRAKRALLDTSAGSDLDMVSASSNFAGDVITNGTTLTSTSEMNLIFSDAAQSGAFGGSNNKVMGCDIVTGSAVNVQGVTLDGCFLGTAPRLRLGTGNLGGPLSTATNCAIDLPSVYGVGSWSISVCLIMSGIVRVTYTGKISTTVFLAAGVHAIVGDTPDFIFNTVPVSLFIGRNHHENATICYDVVRGIVSHNTPLTILNCAKWARVAGAYQVTHSLASPVGNVSGDAIEVLPGGRVKGAAWMGNLTATGNELVVGGTGRTFATAPHTDIGELSQVLP